MSQNLKKDALAYHEMGQPGKVEVVPTKPLSTQLDLALAYSPGVAEPCLEIEKSPETAFRYTSRGNLVGVISNGTAVLGLGNIGALASKPVMEGKGVLFKKFAGIDVFDIEIDEEDPEKFIEIVKSLEPTFGGINLEDIKAPECFKIENELRDRMHIPVMHDDQHGTAIISSAALLNALEIAEKEIADVKVVVSGAGASAVSCTRLYIALGVTPENIVMLDSKGVIRKDRDNLDATKAEFATARDIRTIQDALTDADVFLGLSRGDLLNGDDLRLMSENPIVFALANPNPEIPYEMATEARPDVIMATGRSDYPNQVNNVLGFPYIFRGALDVRATQINEEMKLASVRALAEMAKLPVPRSVKKAYNDNSLGFGREYLIPKPLDTRLITTIAPAVAKAAIESGVARETIEDWEAYNTELEQRIGIEQDIVKRMITQAQLDPKRVIFSDAENRMTLRAAQTVLDEGIAKPILLGNRDKVTALIKEEGLSLKGCPIINPFEEERQRAKYGDILYEMRKRKGVTQKLGKKLMRDRNTFGSMMLRMGDADAMIAGITQDYPTSIKPALQVIGKKPEVDRVAGMYVVTNNKQSYFFADTTVNANPTADELVDIIGLTAEKVRSLGVEPRVAVLSYSNFGSAKGEIPAKAAEAVAKAKAKFPDLVIDGDIQANVALNTELQQQNYPFSALAEHGANTLVFPDLASGNIAYKLLQEIGGAEITGPILMGMDRPVHVMQLGSLVRDIVNLTALAVVEAQQATE
ncbi:NADP-dependent malic enzyme [Fulvitalea axinellae]|uniref:NADP-dependent malic enzyme n=1 Tax=Fulvitalea axinellae TaxID=1182444 RepID=A0AAU9CTH9_9BACT|nr:NADP-dependent malic enzyme [Fulvitalea axinellae]